MFQCFVLLTKVNLLWKNRFPQTLTGRCFFSATAPNRSISTRDRRRSIQQLIKGGSIQMAPWRRSTPTAGRKHAIQMDGSGSKTRMATLFWTTRHKNKISPKSGTFVQFVVIVFFFILIHFLTTGTQTDGLCRILFFCNYQMFIFCWKVYTFVK